MNRKIYSKQMPETARLLLVAAAIIAGAVLRSADPVVGYCVSLAGLGWYLVSAALAWRKMIRPFSGLTPRMKARLLITGVLFVIFVWSLFDFEALNYFLVILLLAIEYLLLDSPETGAGKNNTTNPEN